MTINSTTTASSRKSNENGWAKPYEDFPLSYHPPSGRLYKKIRGKRYYYGYANDWQSALDKYLNEKEDREAGREPRDISSGGLTLKDLCNEFLTEKNNKYESGEIVWHTFTDYKRVCDRLVSFFGKTRLVDDISGSDFRALRADIAKTCGLVRLSGEITRIRVVFNYAFEESRIDSPVRFGSSFAKPKKSALRRERQKNGKRLFEATDILAMLDSASTQLRAMIYLGINAGFGNSDCGSLPVSRLRLETGWLDFPRPKNGIERRCPLWPETVQALREAIDARPEPVDKANADLVFLTRQGDSWNKQTSDNPVSNETAKLLKRLGIQRRGVSFYALRHTFRTVSDATRDFPAVRIIMGHSDPSIDAHYREEIDDSRLQAVSNHVHAWLFGVDAEG